MIRMGSDGMMGPSAEEEEVFSPHGAVFVIDAAVFVVDERREDGEFLWRA